MAVYGHRRGKDGITDVRWLFPTQPTDGIEFEHPKGFLHVNLCDDGTLRIQASGNGKTWDVDLVLQSLCGNWAVLRLEDNTPKPLTAIDV